MAGMLNPDRPDPAAVTDVKTVVAEVPVDDVTDVSRETEDPNAYDDDDEEPNVTPEEQAEYEAFIEAGTLLIYADPEGVRPKVNEGIVAMLDDDPSDLIEALGAIPELENKFSPITALAAATVVVTLEVVRNTDPRPSDDVIFEGGRHLLQDLAQLAPTEFEQQDLNAAMLMAAHMYAAIAEQEGLVDKEATSQAFADLMNAQDEDRVDEVLPGASRFANGDR